MKPCMKIIYEGHEESNDGSIRKVLRTAFIEFSERTTEYINTLSYAENMEAMIFDILDNGFVVVGNGVAIPIFGIREFLAQTSHEDTGQKNNQNVQASRPMANNPPRVNFNKKNKKMHRRIENQSQKTQHNQATPIAVTPIVPENILPKPDVAQ